MHPDNAVDDERPSTARRRARLGLESLATLPRLNDLGADVTEIRARLEAVVEKRPAQ